MMKWWWYMVFSWWTFWSRYYPSICCYTRTLWRSMTDCVTKKYETFGTLWKMEWGLRTYTYTAVYIHRRYIYWCTCKYGTRYGIYYMMARYSQFTGNILSTYTISTQNNSKYHLLNAYINIYTTIFVHIPSIFHIYTTKRTIIYEYYRLYMKIHI
jgi:hypothetical protein